MSLQSETRPRDSYSLRARTLPMFVVLLPVATVIAAWTPGFLSIATGLGSTVAVAGASFYLGQLSRLVGKPRERSLWRGWGGSPTVQFLRHRDREYNQQQKRSCHRMLKQMGESVPTPEEEEQNPRVADEKYEACARSLIARTRDQQRFALLFQENINYGFWRNLWALRPFGITVALVALAMCVLRAWPKGATPYAEVALVGGGIDLVLLLVWWLAVSPDAVRIPAKAYAERLLEACVELGEEKKP